MNLFCVRCHLFSVVGVLSDLVFSVVGWKLQSEQLLRSGGENCYLFRTKQVMCHGGSTHCGYAAHHNHLQKMGDHYALFVPFSGFSFAQAIQIMGLDDWCVCKLGCFRKKRDDDEPEDTLCDGSERWTALLSFFIFGLINNFAYVVFLTGAESFLPGQSALVLLAEMLPTLIVQGIAPLFVERIPFWMRISYITLTACLAFFLVAFFTQTALKFVGMETKPKLNFCLSNCLFRYCCCLHQLWSGRDYLYGLEYRISQEHSLHV